MLKPLLPLTPNNKIHIVSSEEKFALSTSEKSNHIASSAQTSTRQQSDLRVAVKRRNSISSNGSGCGSGEQLLSGTTSPGREGSNLDSPLPSSNNIANQLKYLPENVQELIIKSNIITKINEGVAQQEQFSDSMCNSLSDHIVESTEALRACLSLAASPSIVNTRFLDFVSLGIGKLVLFTLLNDWSTAGTTDEERNRESDACYSLVYSIVSSFPDMLRRVHRTSGRMMLHHACCHIQPRHSLKTVTFLLKAYPDAAGVADNSGSLPLHLAISEVAVDTAVVAELIRVYPKACAIKDKTGSLPLHRSVRCSNPRTAQIAKIVLAANMQAARITDHQGLLPIHIAVNQPNTKDLTALVSELYEAFPDSLRTVDPSGCLPLHLSVSQPKPDLEVIQFIVNKFPGGLEQLSRNGRTALHMAVESPLPSVEAVHFILSNYPNAASIADNFGYFPLHLALDQAEPSPLVVELLLRHYPKATSVMTADGLLPLHIALAGGPPHQSILEALMEASPVAATQVATEYLPTDPRADALHWDGPWLTRYWTPLSRAIDRHFDGAACLMKEILSRNGIDTERAEKEGDWKPVPTPPVDLLSPTHAGAGGQYGEPAKLKPLESFGNSLSRRASNKSHHSYGQSRRGSTMTSHHDSDSDDDENDQDATLPVRRHNRNSGSHGPNGSGKGSKYRSPFSSPPRIHPGKITNSDDDSESDLLRLSDSVIRSRPEQPPLDIAIRRYHSPGPRLSHNIEHEKNSGDEELSHSHVQRVRRVSMDSRGANMEDREFHGSPHPPPIADLERIRSRNVSPESRTHYDDLDTGNAVDTRQNNHNHSPNSSVQPRRSSVKSTALPAHTLSPSYHADLVEQTAAANDDEGTDKTRLRHSPAHSRHNAQGVLGSPPKVQIVASQPKVLINRGLSGFSVDSDDGHSQSHAQSQTQNISNTMTSSATDTSTYRQGPDLQYAKESDAAPSVSTQAKGSSQLREFPNRRHMMEAHHTAWMSENVLDTDSTDSSKMNTVDGLGESCGSLAASKSHVPLPSRPFPSDLVPDRKPGTAPVKQRSSQVPQRAHGIIGEPLRLAQVDDEDWDAATTNTSEPRRKDSAVSKGNIKKLSV